MFNQKSLWPAVQRSYLLTNRYAMYINAVQRSIRVKTHCWAANQKGLSVLPNPLHANQWLFYKLNQARNVSIIPTICFIISFSSLCFNDTPLFSGPFQRVESHFNRLVPGSVLSGLGIWFLNLHLLHFDHIIASKHLSISLSLSSYWLD